MKTNYYSEVGYIGDVTCSLESILITFYYELLVAVNMINFAGI